MGVKRSVYNNWVEDFIWAAPDGVKPSLRGIQVYNGEYCEGHRTQTLHFAGEEYLALEQQSAGYCEDAAHPWFFSTLAVVPIDSTTHLGLTISEVLGDAATDALYEGASDYLERIGSAEDRALYMQEPDEANWIFVRRPGRWVVQGRLETGEVTQDAFADFEVDVDLPSSIVRRNQLQPSWEQIKTFAPDAIDAFSSPEREFVVILRPSRLTAHPVSDGRIGPASVNVRVRPGATAVMARWATGPRVQRWAEHIAATPRQAQSGLR